MNLGKSLAASAIAGILAAACGGGQVASKTPKIDPAAGGVENGCGNHDGGACGAMDSVPPKSSQGGSKDAGG
jgi:hypothetical protein